MSAPIFPQSLQFSHIYVHLPFCETICHYCDFYVARAKEARHDEFFAALHRELDHWRARLQEPVRTLYFGGGTPSESPTNELARFIDSVRPLLAKDAEICLEANPTSIDAEKVAAWQAMGVGRVSIGIQSLQPALLKRLGRVHSREQAIAAVELARAKIPRLTVDLMYGVPEQSLENLRADARELAGLGVDHLSAYTLTLEKEHFLFPKLPSSDSTIEASTVLRQTLAESGLEMYEASNYARPGFESRHNTCYWEGRPYLALGPSAHGFDGDRTRWKNVADWQKYVGLTAKQGHSIAEQETLSPEQQKLEYLFTRLRTRRGIEWADFTRRFGSDLRVEKGARLRELEKAGHGRLDNQFWKPSFSGMMLADPIALELS